MPVVDNEWMKSLVGRDGVGFGGPDAHLVYPPDLEVEPIHHGIDLALDLQAQAARAQVTITCQVNREGAQTLELDAVQFLDLQVKDPRDEGLTWGYDGKKIRLHWSAGLTRGDQREVVLTYRVERPVAGLYFMKPTVDEPDRPYYAATDHEPVRARYWLPSIDHPSVRTRLTFRITADKSYEILAAGTQLDETVNKDGTKTARWKLEERCPSYLVCFAVGDFVRADDNLDDGFPVAYFACRDFTEDDLRRSFGRTRDMLAWMPAKLDLPFPFPKYYQFALPDFSGAMENISLVSWSDRFVLTEDLAKEWSWLVDQINVHEMAHSYFGDLVVCRDFAHLWLKESWATYMETCWLEDQKGEDEKLYDVYRNTRAYIKEADESYKRPIVTRKFTSPWQMFDRHLYPGGAVRLNALREELGDAAFWEGVRDYLKTYQGTVAETDDFRKIMEKHSGKTLVKFFDQWFHTAGYPDLKVSFHYDEGRKEGTFEIEQKQADGKEKLPTFDFSTELGWSVEGRSETKRVRVTKAKETFTVPMTEEPSQVRFDPQGKVPCKLEFNPGDDKLRTQLTKAEDVLGRIHAAHTLKESGDQHNARALVQAWEKEPFWGVRREIVQALADMQTASALEGLLRVSEGETDPLVLDQVFTALGRFHDERVTKAIVDRIDKGGLPPVATLCAYEALGKQHAEAPVDFIKERAERDGLRPHQLERLGALRALGETREESAVQFLEEHTGPGRLPYRIRSGAVTGMGRAAAFWDKPKAEPVLERLTELLRDPDETIRMTAARALIRADAKSRTGHLAAFRKTLPSQDQVEIDEGVESLKKKEEDKVAGVKKELEELRTQYRKLTERLEALEAGAGSANKS